MLHDVLSPERGKVRDLLFHRDQRRCHVSHGIVWSEVSDSRISGCQAITVKPWLFLQPRRRYHSSGRGQQRLHQRLPQSKRLGDYWLANLEWVSTTLDSRRIAWRRHDSIHGWQRSRWAIHEPAGLWTVFQRGRQHQREDRQQQFRLQWVV